MFVFLICQFNTKLIGRLQSIKVSTTSQLFCGHVPVEGIGLLQLSNFLQNRTAFESGAKFSDSILAAVLVEGTRMKHFFCHRAEISIAIVIFGLQDVDDSLLDNAKIVQTRVRGQIIVLVESLRCGHGTKNGHEGQAKGRQALCWGHVRCWLNQFDLFSADQIGCLAIQNDYLSND